MRQSENLVDLLSALSLAQGELEGAIKDATNPHFGRKHATLASVIAAIRSPLSKNGLSYIQLVTSHDSVVSVETILAHKTGQFISETLDMPLLQKSAQGVGGTITYGRRYALMAMVGIAPEDDDGVTASEQSAHPQTQLPAKEERQAAPQTPLDEGRRRAFMEDAKQTWAKLRSQEECGAWWASTKEARIAAFPDRSEANKDYKEFAVAFAQVGAKLPEKTPVTTNGATEKPKDDIPAFKGDAGRPSEANIRMDFKAALIKAIDRDGANDAFIKHIEPHEKGLPKAFLDEMCALLAKRCDEVKD